MVKIGNRFVQGFGREGAKELLESTEGHGAFVEIGRGFCFFETEAVLDVIVDPKKSSLFICQIIGPVYGFYQMQAFSGIGDLLR